MAAGSMIVLDEIPNSNPSKRVPKEILAA